MRLFDKLSIDIWKEIADIVQLMEISTFDNEEFARNLIFLRESLRDRGININFGKTNPRCCLEIGLLNLLRAIYSADVYGDYKMANFYEKIYQLDNLGISNIVFNPIDFPDRVANISLIKNPDGEIAGIYKCFTDGEFKIDYTDSPLDRWYDLVDIKNDNYIMCILLEQDNNNLFINREQSYIVLKNFNGYFPSKDTFLEMRYPDMSLYSKYLDDGRKQYYFKQLFYSPDRYDIEYPKKLVKSYDSYHYK